MTIFAPLAGAVTISTNPGVTAGVGFVLTSGSAPLRFSVKDDGDILFAKWFAINDGTDRTVAVLDGQFDELNQGG